MQLRLGRIWEKQIRNISSCYNEVRRIHVHVERKTFVSLQSSVVGVDVTIAIHNSKKRQKTSSCFYYSLQLFFMAVLCRLVFCQTCDEL